MRFLAWLEEGDPLAIWKRRLRLDGVILFLCFFVMFGRLTGNPLHETAALLFFLLVALHGTLNRRWYQRKGAALFKKGGSHRKPSLRDNVLFGFNCLLAVLFLGSVLSGILSSQSLFRNIFPESWHTDLFYRSFHLGVSVWFFIGIGLHIGLHSSLLFQKPVQFLTQKLGEKGSLWIGLVSLCLGILFLSERFLERDWDLILTFQSAFIPSFRGESVFRIPLELLVFEASLAGGMALLRRFYLFFRQ